MAVGDDFAQSHVGLAEERIGYLAYLLDNIHDAVIAVDESMMVTAWNLAAEQMYGWKAEEVINRDIREFFRSELSAESREAILLALRDTGRYRLEFIQYRRDGEPVYVEATTIALRRENGECAGYVTVNRDMSERKRIEEERRKAHLDLEMHIRQRTADLEKTNLALQNEIIERTQTEEALRQSEEKYRAILNNIQDGYYEVDLKGNFTFFNQSVCNIFRCSGQEIKGVNYREYTDPDTARKVFAVFNRVYRTHEAAGGFDYEVRAKDDSYRVIEVSVSLIMEEGRAVGFRGILRDITERREAEEALRKSEERYRAFVAQSSEGIWRFEAAQPISIELSEDEQIKLIYRYGHLAECNDAMARMYGFSKAAEILGVSLRDLLNPSQPKNIEYLRAFIRSGYRLTDAESVELNKDGNPWHAVNNLIGIIENGFLVRAWGNQRDVTERKRAEEARREILRQLVFAQEEERRRISRELHDQMGQHLAALMLRLNAFRESSPAQSFEHIDSLQKIVEQLDKEVDRLAIELRPPTLDDLGLYTALTNHIREWSDRNRIPIDFHSTGIDRDRLPPDIETTLYRIVQEALTNILKHAEASRASLILERRNDHILAIVEDNGCGFDVDGIKQSPNIRRKLGLLGMQERVSQVGGTLNIESAPGAGTTLFVRIPLSRHQV